MRTHGSRSGGDPAKQAQLTLGDLRSPRGAVPRNCAWEHGGMGAEKSAEAIVGCVVGEASQALQCLEAELTDRPNRKRQMKGRTKRTKEQSEPSRWA
jgi:hypothetical protein